MFKIVKVNPERLEKLKQKNKNIVNTIINSMIRQ